MKKLLRCESTIRLEAAVLKCPNAELYLYLLVSHNLGLRGICPAPEKDQWRVFDNKKLTVRFYTKGGNLC
jgi:hypothetical protein